MLSEVTVSVVIRIQSFSPNTLKPPVVDSHGRDKDGRISSDGMSVLMFFDNVSSFIHYVAIIWIHITQNICCHIRSNLFTAVLQ